MKKAYEILPPASHLFTVLHLQFCGVFFNIFSSQPFTLYALYFAIRCPTRKKLHLPLHFYLLKFYLLLYTLLGASPYPCFLSLRNTRLKVVILVSQMKSSSHVLGLDETQTCTQSVYLSSTSNLNSVNRLSSGVYTALKRQDYPQGNTRYRDFGRM